MPQSCHTNQTSCLKMLHEGTQLFNASLLVGNFLVVRIKAVKHIDNAKLFSFERIAVQIIC